MIDRTALLSSTVARDAIAGGRRDLPPPQNPGDGTKGAEGAGRHGELSHMLATMFATHESVHAALRN